MSSTQAVCCFWNDDALAGRVLCRSRHRSVVHDEQTRSLPVSQACCAITVWLVGARTCPKRANPATGVVRLLLQNVSALSRVVRV